MTLLTARDGSSDEFDYIDIAEALAEHGDVTIKQDLAELWRRVAFFVAIHNTDDHLRNHGFLRGRAGWTLSPVFDVNPNPDTAKEREVGIGAAHSRDDEIDGLMASAATLDSPAATPPRCQARYGPPPRDGGMSPPATAFLNANRPGWPTLLTVSIPFD